MPTASKSKEEQAEEYKARAEADFDPNETARQRLERLTAEVKELEASVVEKERAEAAAKVLPKIREVVKLIEAQNPGKVARSVTVRFARPGDEEPEIVEKMEPGKPGVVVNFRVVTPRAKQGDSSKSE